MKCHVCGSSLAPLVSDMPFKTGPKRIVIIKDLPLLQCGNCSEYVLEDNVMKRVDTMLAKVDKRAELEILQYAA